MMGQLHGGLMGSLLAASWVLFADGASGMEPWGNLTALGILGVVVIWIVTKTIPDLHSKFVALSEHHATKINEMQASYTKAIGETQTAFAGVMEAALANLTREISDTRIHCAAVNAKQEAAT